MQNANTYLEFCDTVPEMFNFSHFGVIVDHSHLDHESESINSHKEESKIGTDIGVDLILPGKLSNDGIHEHRMGHV